MRSSRTRHLDRSIDAAAHIWNHSVACHKRYYRLFGKTLRQGMLQSHLARHRRGRFKHWQRMDAQAVQSVADRLYRAWDAFFKGESKRPPTFKSKEKYRSFTLKQNGWKIIRGGRIRIQSRNYRIHQHRDILGDIKTVTIHRDKTGRHFVTFSCDNVPAPELKPKTGKTAGCDFGLRTFITLSTGEKIAAPLPFKKALRQIRVASRNFSRKKKGSKSREKARLELSNLHRKIANQRDDWQWKVARDLASRFDALAFEDLNLVAMKSLWGRKVSDLGFYNFLRKQEWLCVKYGRQFAKTPRFEPTTKRMSCCGHVQPVALSETIVTCEKCGTVHDRDVNAAISIKELGRQLWSGVGSKTPPGAACVITAESCGPKAA